MQTISIAKQFTQFPGGRYRRNGKGSGQEFREDFLVPLLKSGNSARIVLDGVSGYPPSFLEEAFGGLIREGFAVEELKKHIEFSATPSFESYKHMIWSYVERAAQLQGEH